MTCVSLMTIHLSVEKKRRRKNTDIEKMKRKKKGIREIEPMGRSELVETKKEINEVTCTRKER